MGILLTQEEIDSLEEDCVDCRGHNEKEVAKAQLKKVVEWLDNQDFYVRRLAPGTGFTGDYYLLRESPSWQALLKESE